VQAVLALLCLGQLEACFSAHGGPKDSTETGNPPAIDTKLVTLKVSADMVHIAGAKGAVTPGGNGLMYFTTRGSDRTARNTNILLWHRRLWLIWSATTIRHHPRYFKVLARRSNG
jgi:hypothetical protein